MSSTSRSRCARHSRPGWSRATFSTIRSRRRVATRRSPSSSPSSATIRIRSIRSSASSRTAISLPCTRMPSSHRAIADLRWSTSCASSTARSQSTGTWPSQCRKSRPIPTGCSDPMRFAGQSVVVLGGNSGIGLAAARAFQAEGARVAITGRNEATLAQVAAASGMLAVRSDMSSVADSRAAPARIAEQLGGIDVLFVNAGIGGFAAVPEVTEEFWDSVHGVNLRGAFFALQAALPHVRDGGSIVITGSIGAVLALPGNVVYAAAKAGLRAVARILAAELLPRAIRVNVVSPGPTETEIFKRGASLAQIEAVRSTLGGAVPMKRMGEPEEVARAVLFLASEEASFINGVDLNVDGGCLELSPGD